MNPLFVVLAALMLLAALALVLRPLFALPGNPRNAQRRALDQALAAGVINAAEHAAKLAATDHGSASAGEAAQNPWLLAGGLALAMVAGTLSVYFTQGTPAALNPEALTAAPAEADLDTLLARLEERLTESPDDPAGWALLARGQRSAGRVPEAAAAYSRAIALAPGDADLLVEGAETIALNHPDRSLAGEPLSLLARALVISPDHQRGLWLTGIAHAQAGAYESAISTWTRLEALLAPGSEVATAVAEQISEARRQMGDVGSSPDSEMPAAAGATSARSALASEAAAAQAAPAPTATTASAGITVVVDIDPSLVQKVPEGATLFVFARAAEGPRLPLAIARLPATGFPVTVTLDDSSAMVAGMNLSSQPRIVVGARISASGNATPQSGDLEGLSEPIEHAALDGPLALSIGRVLP
jgi:cytochrome c-type biogenesis protein CcmH